MKNNCHRRSDPSCLDSSLCPSLSHTFTTITDVAEALFPIYRNFVVMMNNNRSSAVLAPEKALIRKPYCPLGKALIMPQAA